ncbi:MAG TPA: glycosyltransferase [Candidatus Saccharimonadia bacterium]|nr:glycosyltransferase [Candidatus Saccharimonadia bacterium]
MKILMASDLHWPTINGIATAGRTLAQGLAERGHDVVVVAPSQTGKRSVEMDGNYRVMRTASVVFPFYQNLRISLSPNREINQITKEFTPDVIHLQTPLAVGLGAIGAAKKYHVPLVATNHAMSENFIDNLKLLAPFARQIDFMLREYGSRFYSNADVVTLPTQAAIRMLKPDSFSKPFVAISNGVDLSRFKSGKVSAEFYERFGIPMGVPVVMYLGRLDAEKHVGVLVRAAHRLLGRVKFHLVIVGDGNDLAHLKELARDLNMTDRVTFTGKVDEDDKPTILRLGSLFVMPSPAELQSIATLEAMATGMPVVVVNAGAVYELCQEGRNGYLFEVDDYEELADRMGRIVGDKTVVEQFGAVSLQIARTHDLANTITAYEKLYEQVVREHKPKIKRRALLGVVRSR